MPVILSQHFLSSDREYEDVEYSLYHFPNVYFGRVKPYDRFIYYRPLGESKRRSDSLHYFGHGILGQPFEDPLKANHRFVPIVKGEPFKAIVPLRDPDGLYYETESTRPPIAQSAVRVISEVTYYRILAAAGVSSTVLERMPSTEEQLQYASPLASSAPKDKLREIVAIPPGAGYVPTGNSRVDVYESAALQERARADHQSLLQTLAAAIQTRGGRTWYNNNIDLLGEISGSRMLIEAKSLNAPEDAVHRMRYGLGQLFDYRHRYKEEIRNATPVLGFGRMPDRSDAWIGSVLQENGVAFVSQVNKKLVALNSIAEQLPIF